MAITSIFLSCLLALFIMMGGAIREVMLSTDPCGSIVWKSEPRNEEPNECKCKEYFQKVWCPGKGKIHERKFHPDDIKTACPDGGAYCAKKENKAVLPASVTRIQGNTNDDSQVENEKDMLIGSEQTQSHVQDGLDTNTQAVPATNDVSQGNKEKEDPNDVWVAMAPAFWVSKNFKCCEHSQGEEDPQIVYIKDTDNLPQARMACKDRKGCGCIFGDHWHSIDHKKSPGQCLVTLAYAMEATGWPYEQLIEYRQDPGAAELKKPGTFTIPGLDRIKPPENPVMKATKSVAKKVVKAVAVAALKNAV